MHNNSIKQKGKLNSQYGTVWYFNQITQESKKFKLGETIPNGWVKGRKILQSKQFDLAKVHKQQYDKNPKLCGYCNKPIPYERRFKKTCCNDCGKALNRKSNYETNLIRHSLGGKRHGSGRGKKGWYNGIWCDSSWELAWVIYNIKHNIKFVRYHGYFEYQFEGKSHKYYPDFELEDGTLVEVKGYSTPQWKAKLEQFPKNKQLQVIGKIEIKPILEYVTTKYGNNFIDLYN